MDGKDLKSAQDVETVIIGTGFSGLLAAIRLQKKHFILSRKWFRLSAYHLIR